MASTEGGIKAYEIVTNTPEPMVIGPGFLTSYVVKGRREEE